jgi:hypothetical protein
MLNLFMVNEKGGGLNLAIQRKEVCRAYQPGKNINIVTRSALAAAS